MSHKIFISYRRFDTAGTAGRLHDGLNQAFGEEFVFRDVHDIPAGVDFREVLNKELERCKVVLVLIGQHYLSVKDEAGNLRLHNPNDFVHLEVSSALQMNKIVIPVLVDGAGMPKAQELPENLRELVNFNAVVISHDRWQSDVQVLVKKLEYHVGPARKRPGIVKTPSKKPRGIFRSLGPMALGGILTLFFLVILAMVIPNIVESNARSAQTEGEMKSVVDKDQPEDKIYEAGFTTPEEYGTETQTERITEPSEPVSKNNQATETAANTLETAGGYAVPQVEDQTAGETDYWGFDNKQALEDVIVGTWEQTYPTVLNMTLREYFGADGAYANNYQKKLFYIVVQNFIQINGRNAYEIIHMNKAGTEMELRSLEGGGLIQKYRKIL